MKKKSYLASTLSFVLLFWIGGVFSYIHTRGPYTEYRKLWEYRRLHPQLTLSSETLTVATVGHTTTYADILWMRLMQFIADNIGNGAYLNFTHTILDQVQSLHPQFARAYEFDILFLPSLGVDEESVQYKKNKKMLEEALAGYDTKIQKICDMQKIRDISTLGFGVELSERRDLANPCISGLIPYYLASRYDSDLGDRKKAAWYYKIASMHDDVPTMTRFLGIIAFANTGNYRDGALTFSLLAHNGYDESPFLCQQLALRLGNDLSEKIPWTKDWISTLETEQRSLKRLENNTPMSVAGGTCYDLLERGVKQVYIGYITLLTQDYPDIKNEADILNAGIIKSVPKISSQSGFTIEKKNDVWRYILRI